MLGDNVIERNSFSGKFWNLPRIEVILCVIFQLVFLKVKLAVSVKPKVRRDTNHGNTEGIPLRRELRRDYTQASSFKLKEGGTYSPCL